ncbi:hypothetical protein FALBO_16982 [Fusarium albosuccineum]|uniref:Uncharacterized protein n=1 Tax=Fusarium albosuccineum TaxID=1237068 RepID=A0A8H4KDS6_9HYPO|nr:hypothetical protein FALBO_16982 [Fusarium albosuccineum]
MAFTPCLSSYSSIFSYAGGATRANIGGARAKEHLDKALAEVDGLFAGLRYLDETEPAPQTSGHPNDHLKTSDSLELELEALSSASSSSASSANEAAGAQQCDPKAVPSAHEIAWSSIRNVRDGMQILWKHFVDESLRLDSPIVHNLRAAYRDATGLREAGVFAFRNTLTGPPPNDLTKVFAFCSLSYVVSRLLHTSGRLKQKDVLAGVRLWLDALETKEEREAFKILAQNLWPEARNHLHFHDLGIDQRCENMAATLRRSNYIPGQVSSNCLSPCSASLQPESWINCETPAQEPRIQDLTEQDFVLPLTEPATLDDSLLNTFASDESMVHACNLMNMAYDTMHFSLGLDPPANPWITTPPQFWYDSGEFVHANPDLTEHVSMENTTGPASMDPDLSLEPSADTTTHADRLEKLKDTMVLTAVLRYFEESGAFLYVLSGRGMLSNDLRSCLAWNQERSGEKRRIQLEYLHRLAAERHTKDAPSRGIVSVADKFVEVGYLQTIEDVQDYMTTIGRELFLDDKVAYREFREWVHAFRESSQSSPASSISDNGKTCGNSISLNV